VIRERKYKPELHIVAYEDRNCNGIVDKGDFFYSLDSEVYSRNQNLVIISKPIERKAGKLAGIKVLREGQPYKVFVSSPVEGQPGARAGIMEIRRDWKPVFDFHTRLNCDNSSIYMGPIRLSPGDYKSFGYSKDACTANNLKFKVR